MSVSLLPTLALVLVPVVTGFTSVLWSPIAALSWTAMALLNAVTYGLVWGAIALARPEDPGLADVVRVVGWPVVAGYVLGSVAVSVLWFAAHERTGVVWIAFTETGWGFAALLFTAAFCRLPGSVIRPLEITPAHLVGGALVVAGVVVLALAGRGESVVLEGH